MFALVVLPESRMITSRMTLLIDYLQRIRTFSIQANVDISLRFRRTVLG